MEPPTQTPFPIRLPDGPTPGPRFRRKLRPAPLQLEEAMLMQSLPPMVLSPLPGGQVVWRTGGAEPQLLQTLTGQVSSGSGLSPQAAESRAQHASALGPAGVAPSPQAAAAPMQPPLVHTPGGLARGAGPQPSHLTVHASPSSDRCCQATPKLQLPRSPAGMAGAAASTPSSWHVWFNSPLNSSVAITPYAQVYGIHPRYFQFDAGGSMQPTPRAEAGFLGPAGLAAAVWMRWKAFFGVDPPAECVDRGGGARALQARVTKRRTGLRRLRRLAELARLGPPPRSSPPRQSMCRRRLAALTGRRVEWPTLARRRRRSSRLRSGGRSAREGLEFPCP
mmetsp:Transcript_108219/g.304958  ORF Transcript_108219/g.304958 Transcript_108219/m.304958 type:complete len:335 (+) Transcript_108219:43-1047(+)